MITEGVKLMGCIRVRLGEDIKVIVIPSGEGLDLVLPEIKP